MDKSLDAPRSIATTCTTLFCVGPPHRLCIWDNLPEAIADFAKQTYAARDLTVVEKSDNSVYSMLPDRLLYFGHIVLALTQVLQGLSDLLGYLQEQSFEIDLGFNMICLLAWHKNPIEMVLTIPLLQERTVLAVKHIHKLFNAIKKSVLPFNEAISISSYNSTSTK